LNRQKLNVREIDLDITRDDQPLVEDAIQDLNEAGTTRRRNEVWHMGSVRKSRATRPGGMMRMG
jgi:hypothetical protein